MRDALTKIILKIRKESKIWEERFAHIARSPCHISFGMFSDFRSKSSL